MTSVTENKTFEQKMMDRVRDSIGDLMSNTDLARIVEKGIQDSFFRAKKDSYGRDIPNTVLAENICREIMKVPVTEAVNQWFKDHNEEILDMIKKTVDEGMSRVIMEAINSKFNMALWNFGEMLKSTIKIGN